MFLNTALAEAKDIALYLKPLLPHFAALQETDFAEIRPCLQPLMHVVCLVWANSRYYCNSAKIIVLLRQICNLLIKQVQTLSLVISVKYMGGKRLKCYLPIYFIFLVLSFYLCLGLSSCPFHSLFLSKNLCVRRATCINTNLSTTYHQNTYEKECKV